MKIRFAHILMFLLILMLPVLLTLVNARLIMTETYLYLEYKKPDFPPDFYGFTLQDRLHYGPYALQYVFNGAGIDYLSNVTLPDGTPLYKPQELSHLEDVKSVVRVIFGVMAVLIFAFGCFSIFLLASKDRRRLFWQGLLSGSMLTLVILAGLTAFVLLRWDTFFDDFHEIFFSQGNWIFQYSDSLIRLYPVRFWQDSVLTIGVLIALEAVLLLALSWWQLRRSARYFSTSTD